LWDTPPVNIFFSRDSVTNEMDIKVFSFWLVPTFCGCGDGFQGLAKAFHYLPCTNINFFIYFLLWNYLSILKMLTETLLRISLSVIGWCSLLPTSHWLQGKCARINLSRTASVTILHNQRRLPVSIFSVKSVALGSLKRVKDYIYVRILHNDILFMSLYPPWYTVVRINQSQRWCWNWKK
jgi:hypothetical protein